MFNVRYVLILVFLLSLKSFAQLTNNPDSLLLFRGVVIDASTMERLAGTVIAINRINRTASNTDGTFSFLANHLDTVEFTMMGYKPLKIIISDTLHAPVFLTGVYLHQDTVAIGEVIIVPRFPLIMSGRIDAPKISDINIENARNNINIAAWQGKTSQPRFGDPMINYEYLRNKQKVEAYEKGGIPSDKMVGLSPLLLIPTAYLLINGFPEKPEFIQSSVSQSEIFELNELFLEKIRKKQEENAGKN